MGVAVALGSLAGEGIIGVEAEALWLTGEDVAATAKGAPVITQGYIHRTIAAVAPQVDDTRVPNLRGRRLVRTHRIAPFWSGVAATSCWANLIDIPAVCQARKTAQAQQDTGLLRCKTGW